MKEILTLTLNPALDRTMYFDTFSAGTLNRSSRSVMAPGGKGINVSRALYRMGVPTRAFSFRGGRCGALLAAMLEEEGFPCSFAESAAETRINIKLMQQNGEYTEANEAGGPILPGELQNLIDLMLRSAESPQLFVLSGSIPQGVEKSVYNFLISRLRGRGHRVALDCDGEALRLGLKAGPCLIKPNHHELSALVGRPLRGAEEVIGAAESTHVETGASVLCTMGENGAVYAGDEGIYTVNTPQVKAAGFACAGDTFLGAFLAVRETGGSLEDALRTASSAAAAKIELPGTALPDSREALEKYCGALHVVRHR